LIDENTIHLSEDLECLYKVTAKDRNAKDDDVFLTHDVTDRTNEGIREEMRLVASGQVDEVKGVISVSPFFCLLWFNLVFGLCGDYMHAVLLGVTKAVTGFFLDSSNKDENFYIGLKFKEVDDRLLKIIPPTSVSWRPRSLKERAHWKANEWRMWLLLYSLPCLQGALKPAYLKHHCLLVTAIFILLGDHITKYDLKSAATYLMIYVYDFQKLYGKRHMSFNVHLLLHFGRFVKM